MRLLLCVALILVTVRCFGAGYYREEWEDENGIGEPEEPSADPEEGPGDPEEPSADPEEGPGDPEEPSADPEEGPGDPEEPSADPEEGLESEELSEESYSDRILFKQFSQLEEPSEKWPEDFYRTMSICVNETVNGTSVYRKEGDKACPAGKTVAVGHYKNAVNETGWGILEVETFKGFSPELQAYSAGLVEGSLTKLQIMYHHRNTVKARHPFEFGDPFRLYRYLNQNLEWIGSQVQVNQKDLYWRQVNLTFHQLTGLDDGYSNVPANSYKPQAKFNITPVYMIQLSGELFDLAHVFEKKARSKDEAVKMEEPSHCSGMVKVANGSKDLAMSGFNTMNRVVKLYKFAYDRKEVPGYAVAFSGYPGALASADDYTLSSAGLLSIETTISVFNEGLYQRFVSAKGQLHCWLRSYIANQLTSTAHDWVKLFARFNSGTYNNQWTVVDFKLFKPGNDLPDANLIWILEQIPGVTVSRDVTWFLRKYSYWPSYNIPYLRHISELSGFDQKGTQNNWWRWGFCPRAKIYHRDHHKVQNIDTLREFMRYNDYKHEEFSRCVCNPPYTAEASTSTRGDLNPANGTYELSGMGHRNHGSLDYKGTNYELFKHLRLEVVGGPTFGGPGELPYFSWKTTDIKTPHSGQPVDWNFKPFVTQWRTEVEVAGMEKETNFDQTKFE